MWRFFDWFNRVFQRATDGYVHWSGVPGAKASVVAALLLVFCIAAGFFAQRVPTSFLPKEDQGYPRNALFLPIRPEKALARQMNEIINALDDGDDAIALRLMKARESSG